MVQVHHIAYCFADVKGFSKFGSYTGNGNADGTFVYTGFKPAFVMLKRTNDTAHWQMQDSKRIGFNPENERLYASDSAAEQTINFIDLLYLMVLNVLLQMLEQMEVEITLSTWLLLKTHLLLLLPYRLRLDKKVYYYSKSLV
jgi:hypothetical protein